MLARGDRRGFVAVDVYGEVFSLTRQLGIKAKALEKRLGPPNALPSVAEAKEKISAQVRELFETYREEVQRKHQQELRPLLRIKKTMTDQHRKDRAAQKAYLDKRWDAEQAVRASRIRKGFKGLWDKLTLKYWSIRKANEKEAWSCYVRDREERQELIEVQLEQRQKLQGQFDALRKRQEEEMQNLMADMMKLATSEAARDATPDVFKGRMKKPDLGVSASEGRSQGPRRSGRSKDKGHEPDA